MKWLIALLIAMSSQSHAIDVDVAECLRLTEKFYNSMTTMQIREYDELKTCVSEMMALNIQIGKEAKKQARGEK